MKLNPRASSSDLETAREVARRLHDLRRATEKTGRTQTEHMPPLRRPAPVAAPPAQESLVRSQPAPHEPPRGPRPTPAPPQPPRVEPARVVAAAPAPREAARVPPPPAPVAPASRPRPSTPDPPAMRPVEPPAPRKPVAVVEPPPTPVKPPIARPPAYEPPAFEAPPEPEPHALQPELEVTSDDDEPAATYEAPEPAWAPDLSAEADALPQPDDDAELDVPDVPDPMSALGTDAGVTLEAAADDDAIEIEETDTTLEDIVGDASLPSVEDIVGERSSDEIEDEPEPSLAADDEDPVAALAASTAESYGGAGAGSPFESESSPFDSQPVTEELFDLPAPPSWSEVMTACMGLAHSRGAMLIDPAGHVVASSGEWPDPGPEAIATKLVPMMDKALKDAPTRSVSAPLGSQHLTAWRVPVDENMVTVAFIADAPLRADARAPIDAQILSGGGL